MTTTLPHLGHAPDHAPDYVTVRFEPCDRFEGADEPRCTGCGWLDHEHDIDLS